MVTCPVLLANRFAAESGVRIDLAHAPFRRSVAGTFAPCLHSAEKVLIVRAALAHHGLINFTRKQSRDSRPRRNSHNRRIYRACMTLYISLRDYAYR